MEEMKERPPCKGCGNPAHMVLGRYFYCGDCVMKITRKQEEEKEKKIEEMLKSA